MQNIDGKKCALELEQSIAEKITLLKASQARLPMLSVILVGEDPASMSYVGGKEKACARAGILSRVIRMEASVSEADVIAQVVSLNQDPQVDGILVQLPLPRHINSTHVIATIDPAKDVDGLHPVNVARLYDKQPGFVPCTPKGIMTLLQKYEVNLVGKKVVVVGRSALVGRPVAQLLLNQNATVTVCHSKTIDIPHHTKDADIIVVAIGKAKFLSAEYVSQNQVIVDVGITRVDGKLVGDVDYEAVKDTCALITPVPGGVGPMTIASLLENTMEAYLNHTLEN